MLDGAGFTVRIGASAGHKERKSKGISIGALAVWSVLFFVSTSIIEFSTPGAFLATSPAFAKSKGNNGNGNGNGNGKSKGVGNGVGNGGGNNGKGGDTESGGGSDGDPDGGGAIDFHDEGFMPRKNVDIKIIGRDRDRDEEPAFLDPGRKENHLHDGLGFKDKLDLKFLKKDAGNAKEYLELLNPGSFGKNGHAVEVESSAPEKHRGRDDVLRDGFDARDKADIKSLKNNPDTEDYVKHLKVDVPGKSKELTDSDARAQDKAENKAQDKGDAVVGAKADKQEERALKTLEKEERKAEKEALKAEKKAEKDARKAAKKAAKNGEVTTATASSAEDDFARNASRGVELQPIGPGSYTSREVLALGLSPAGSERVRTLGFEISNSEVSYGSTTVRTLFVPKRVDALEALRLLRRELPGESFHLNRLYRPYVPSKDDDVEKQPPSGPGPGGRNCLGDKCYSRTAIHWKDSLAPCTRDISIGVIDTGVDLKHPTFAGRKITQKAFLSEDKKLAPNWHGTGILALLAGRPDSGTPGLIPEANFFVANSFFADENGEAITDTVSLLRSLEWLGQAGAKVVNMSFAGPDDVLVEGRIKTLRSKGLAFAAAAGNEGPAAAPIYPAAYSEVIAVTAVTKDLRVYPSANRGSYIDLAAPGVRIWTALPDGREGYRTGTSFAAPFATAVLALQRPQIISEPEDELLDNLNTIPLGIGERNPIYGRGLLQAPGECPSPGTAAPIRSATPAK